MPTDSNISLNPIKRGLPQACLTLMREFTLACLALVAVGSAPSRTYSQTGAVWRDPATFSPSPSTASVEGTYNTANRRDQEMDARHVWEENDQMRRQVESDSNKLLKLISQLNSEISQSGSDSITQDEAEKFAEIRKLARKVRKEMVNCARGF